MDTITVKAEVNTSGLHVGEVGEVEDTPRIRGLLERGFLVLQPAQEPAGAPETDSGGGSTSDDPAGDPGAAGAEQGQSGGTAGEPDPDGEGKRRRQR